MKVRPTTALILLPALTVLWALWWQVTPARAQPACQFAAGFATVRDLVGPDTVGDCLEDEHINATSGDVEQRTTGGLLVLRQVDNVALFTDGVTNWVNGPDGLQSRPSGDRFAWENDPARPAQAAPSSDDAGTASSPLSGAPSLFVLAPPQDTSASASGAPAPAPFPTATSVPAPAATATPASAATPTRTATPGPAATSAGASAPGRTSPSGGQCPPSHQIKGVTTAGQKLFYEPDRPEYAKVTPEICFTAGGDARDAGYVSAKR